MPSPPPTSSGEPRCADSGPAGGAVLPLVPGFARRPAKKRPLPDAAAVRLLGVPDSAPPYDDSPARPEAAARRRASPRRTPAVRPEPAERAAQARRGRRVAQPVRPGSGGDTGRIAAPGSDQALDQRAGAAAHPAARAEAGGRGPAAGPSHHDIPPGCRGGRDDRDRGIRAENPGPGGPPGVCRTAARRRGAVPPPRPLSQPRPRPHAGQMDLHRHRGRLTRPRPHPSPPGPPAQPAGPARPACRARAPGDFSSDPVISETI
jgi:hypothetical protein